MTFHQERGLERTWVPKAEESYWIAFWGRAGVPAARWKDYLAWGRRFYPVEPVHRSGGQKVLRPPKRQHTNYARWKPPE